MFPRFAGRIEYARVEEPMPTDADVLPPAGATPSFSIDVTLRADPLTAIMLSMVTFISPLVAIYPVGYMHGDRGYWRFFALHRRCSSFR